MMRNLAQQVGLFVCRISSGTSAWNSVISASYFSAGITRYSRSTVYRGYKAWQNLLDSEKRRWQRACAKYQGLVTSLEKRLCDMHQSYSTGDEKGMIIYEDYIYFQDNGCICRYKPNTGEDSLEVLLISEDLGLGDYEIQKIRVSPKQKFMAVTLKGYEREESTCVVVKLDNGPQVTHCIENVFSCEWATDRMLLHTSQVNVQCRQVFATDFSDANGAAQLVYTENDPRFFVDLYCTRDKRFITINSNSKSTSEVRLIDNRCPFEPPVLVQKRIAGVIYYIEHSNGCLYMLRRHGEAAEYKILKAAVSSGMKHWEPVYEVQERTKLVDMEMLKDHCLLFLKNHNQLSLEVIGLPSGAVLQSIKLPAWACALELDHQAEYGAGTVGFSLSSPVHPPVHFEYSLRKKQLSVDTNHSSDGIHQFHTLRLEAKSKDGTSVPLTLLYKDSEKQMRQRPLLIHVYGAYGMDLNMSFKVEKRMLVEEGWLLAYCHVRGGGELGCNWHSEGVLDKKLNGLEDLGSCISHLHGLGYSQPHYSAVEAASAGGVLAGALCNSAPRLFRAVVLEAPFLDVLNTMMNVSLPLTIEEQEEWGNPLSDEKYHRYIKSYCPYQNITPQNYPCVRITAYENDQRVPIQGLLGYITRLRKAARDYCHESGTSESRIPHIYLDVHPGGSHCDSLSWEESLRKVATQLAFLHMELKLDIPRRCKGSTQ
ncbi:prolyl endopeptidase-like [Xenopus laevis]|uniref:Prolyl endopeptidase-like n=1 Tax=Xenopus laevis TaxID=8355 RepID=PPCEL_XENLA|nr:prolyl endopeptidase-like [Xenopus laevis]Q32N48.1 RecName: Full=Prolyl endopeptidase-like; AltName: Full=Prolylendopeptidase-like [Xenopus laevis]AAI08841.1 Unknown (protein for MGC:132259) [Xenopus laevis]